MHNVRLVELPSQRQVVVASGRRSEVELAIVLLLQIRNGDGRGDVLEPWMLDLAFSYLHLALKLLSNLLLHLEVDIDAVFLWHVLEVAHIQIQSAQIILLALEVDTEVLVLA